MSVPTDVSRGALVLALRSAGIRDLAVLRAIETIPREQFLPPHLRHFGSRNAAVPIACGQTMPPPLALALMCEALGVQESDRVLEIGTGSGYATAVLARLAREVVSFERYRTLAHEAERRLKALDIPARIVVGDGLADPQAFGRFDGIVVHAALSAVPRTLDAALANGGRIVAGVPTGSEGPAALVAFERGNDGFVCRRIAPGRMSAPEKGMARVL